MTNGAIAGIRFERYKSLESFKKDYRRLDRPVILAVEQKLKDLVRHPRPKDCHVHVVRPARRASGYQGEIYGVDVPGGYRISFHKLAISETVRIGAQESIVHEKHIAVLRRVLKYEPLGSQP